MSNDNINMKGIKSFLDIVEKKMNTDTTTEVAIMESRLCRKSIKRYSLDFLNTTEKAAVFGKKLFRHDDREKIYVVGVTTRCEPISIQLMGVGTMDSCPLDLRALFRHAILSGAHSIFLYHNHLSLIPTPSVEDIKVTKRVSDIGQLMGIQLHDHIIISGDNYYSLRESRQLH